MTETHLTDEQLDRLRAGLDAQRTWAAHLQACPVCQARFERWRAARPSPDTALAAELAARRVTALRPRAHRRGYYAALAATLAAVSVGVWLIVSPAPTPITVAQPQRAEPVPDVYADLEFYLWLSQQSGEERSEANSS